MFTHRCINITISFSLTIYICIIWQVYMDIGLMSRVFANGPDDWGSIPG